LVSAKTQTPMEDWVTLANAERALYKYPSDNQSSSRGILPI
jgi:hypothetical protein